MSTTVKTGWLEDSNGNKFAPKTLTSQIQTSDGILLEDKIQKDLGSTIESAKTYTDAVQTNLDTHTTNTSNPHSVTAAQIGAAPAYTYGTEDLEEGVSELTPGTLYFVYEE